MNIINKIGYNKYNNTLYNKLNNLNCIENIKHIKLNNTVHKILYNINTLKYIKVLNKPSIFLKINYKELLKLKKNLKSGYLILYTPFGTLTDKKAITYKTGGIILCYIQ